jgi:diguanylate cyclase (GGDEF)-like protein/hemerythrin-like metal-binding protein/PAS domain S-box-containing protein
VHDIQIFPWNSNFETGIARIDDQHQKLVELLNLLASHLAHQSGSIQLHAVFDELAAYAVHHFETEESIWAEFLQDDPWEATHRAVHGGFIQAVLDLKSKKSGLPFDEVVEEILKFLTHWLVFHILEDDMRMAMVVLALKEGKTRPQAKEHADQSMRGAMRVLIDSILVMYDTLSARSLQLTREIIIRQKTEAKLRLAGNVVKNTMDAICMTDANTNILDINPSFIETTQYSQEEILGLPLRAVKTGFQDAALAARIWECVQTNGHWSGELSSQSKSGAVVVEWLTLSAVKDDNGCVSNYVAVFSDITQLITTRHKTDHVASHDALTGLPNRLLLADRLKVSASHAVRNGDFLAVCFLDLDGFKDVNDRLGHAAGDEVLREVAHRLQNIVRGDDTVARLGGDEFVLLLVGLKNQHDYCVLLDRLLLEIVRPIHINIDDQIDIATVSASIGVTLFPSDNSEPEVLLQHADQAMYQAKQAGKSTYRTYKTA